MNFPLNVKIAITLKFSQLISFIDSHRAYFLIQLFILLKSGEHEVRYESE